MTLWQWGTNLAYEQRLMVTCISKQCTIKTLIKALLKNTYDPQRHLVWSEKILLTLRGPMLREAPLNQSTTMRPLKSELQLAEVKV